jgi:hypothetical protein
MTLALLVGGFVDVRAVILKDMAAALTIQHVMPDGLKRSKFLFIQVRTFYPFIHHVNSDVHSQASMEFINTRF